MSERLTLRIDKPIYGGAGLARHEGKAIFTPFTLPGELVTAKVTHSKPSFAEASLDQLLEPAASRATPPCPYFGTCGGCHYQHASYPAQLAIKLQILAETLTRAHLSPLPEIVTHSGDPLRYRNRIRLHIDPVTSALGYRERASHRLLPASECPIAAPELEHALTVLGALCRERRSGQIFAQLELSINDSGLELVLALWLREAADRNDVARELSALCEALQRESPALRGAGVHAAPLRHDKPQRNRRDRRSQRVDHHTLPEDAPGSLVTSWGEPRMSYRVGELDYQVSLGAFFQVNRSLVPELVRLATAGRRGQLAWDLYSGVGLFSCVLARQFERLVAVEGAPVSSGDLRVNLGRSHAAGVGATGGSEVVHSGILEFLGRQTTRSSRKTDSSARPDFVLVDPPRDGLGAEVTGLLAQIRPPDITYVSCDPATLSRDLRALVESGYQIQQLHLIDLFPQTFHLEAVAMLSLA